MTLVTHDGRLQRSQDTIKWQFGGSVDVGKPAWSRHPGCHGNPVIIYIVLPHAHNRLSSEAFKDFTSCALPQHIFPIVKLSQAMSFGNLWHVLKHRVGIVKSATFLSVFAILYAIAVSSFINTANNLNAEASFRQPKQPKGKSHYSSEINYHIIHGDRRPSSATLFIISILCISTGVTTDITSAPNFAGILSIYMLAVDPSQNAITFAYNFTPSATFLGTDPDYEETSQDIKYHTLFTFGSLTIPQFTRQSETYGGQNRFANSVTASGNYAFYPTDEYTMKKVEVTCRFSNTTEDEFVLTPRTPLAIAPRCAFGLNLRSNIPTTFSMDVSDTTGTSVKNAADGASYDLSIIIARPFMFRLYPGFVIFAFWLIIVFELLLMFTLIFFEFRKVHALAALRKLKTFLFLRSLCQRFPLQAEFANVAMFSGLIFALPSFRNSMPLAPPFGSLCDWISFFWAESFAVIGLFIMGCKCDVSAQNSPWPLCSRIVLPGTSASSLLPKTVE